jgi:hypothetical protein
MLDLARHIVDQKSGSFEPEKFEDHYETALVDLINQKRAGKAVRPKERPKGENVVDLMEALRRSVSGASEREPEAKRKPAKKRKAGAGQKEMLMPIAGKKQAKEGARKEGDIRPATEVGLAPEESRMDMKEASAMTEASGLTNEAGDVEQLSGSKPNGGADTGVNRRPVDAPPSDAAMRWAGQLRRVTVKAPLQSLFVAFLLGVWVARRR